MLTINHLVPENIRYATTKREGYRQDKSNPIYFTTCLFISKYTASKNHQKLIQLHIWEEFAETDENLRHSTEINKKETIERVFAVAKEKHDMRWTTLRGLKKLSIQGCLCLLS